MNLTSRRIVGWSMSARLPPGLVCRALETAHRRRKPAPELFMHPERGPVHERSLPEAGRRLLDAAVDELQVLLLIGASNCRWEASSRPTKLSASTSSAMAPPCWSAARHRLLDRGLPKSSTRALVDRVSDPGNRRIQPHGCVGWCTSHRGKVAGRGLESEGLCWILWLTEPERCLPTTGSKFRG